MEGRSPILERPERVPILEAMMRKRGRRVARQPAVMASPCSVVLQRAMSIVAPEIVSALQVLEVLGSTYTRSPGP